MLRLSRARLLSASCLHRQQKYQNTSNNEIEAYLANQTYALEPRHLATIHARLIRSPYTNRQNIVVWNEDAVKIKALEVYKNENAILRAVARKNKIRKRQFDKITRHIEKSARSQKLEIDKFQTFLSQENHKTRKFSKKQIDETNKLIDIIDTHGGISFADLILDEVICGGAN